MQTKGLAQRLWEAFFPPTIAKKHMTFQRWIGSEESFFEYIARKGFVANVAAVDDLNPYLTVYTTPETGEIFAACVRWPNRNIYYTMSQA